MFCVHELMTSSVSVLELQVLFSKRRGVINGDLRYFYANFDRNGGVDVAFIACQVEMMPGEA